MPYNFGSPRLQDRAWNVLKFGTAAAAGTFVGYELASSVNDFMTYMNAPEHIRNLFDVAAFILPAVSVGTLTKRSIDSAERHHYQTEIQNRQIYRTETQAELNFRNTITPVINAGFIAPQPAQPPVPIGGTPAIRVLPPRYRTR